MVLAILVAFLGLHQQHAVDGFVTVECHGGSIFQHGDALHLLYGKAVDRPLHAVNKDENVFLACRLHATEVKCRASAFFALEARVLEGVQAKELAIEGICQADG